MRERALKSADVAREAGVSRATVSYVLNDRRDVRVSDATRQHVWDVARRLGYIGSPAGRALRTGRGEVVLLLLPDWEFGGQLAYVLEDIGQLVAKHGLVCLRYEGPHWQGSLDRLLGRIPVACVVTLAPLEGNDHDTLASTQVPEVRAWLLDQPGHPHTTTIHQADIVKAQIDHLLQQGYPRLAYLATEERHGRPFTDARISAFDEICRSRGLSPMPTAMVSCDVDAIASVLHTWIASSPAPLGVIAWNDLTALGIISAADLGGFQIPHQLGVIGGDDTLVASLTRPSLSSVRFDLASEARGIASQIAAAVGQDVTDQVSDAVLVQVVPRESTARAAAEVSHSD